MATGGQSSSAVSAATTTTKISPRKFSEKIALLNKKEAEGNAEFEEIIKEVQATRSQSANEANSGQSSNTKRDGNNNTSNSNRIRTIEQWPSDEREKIEQVFQSLIKDVSQFDDLDDIRCDDLQDDHRQLHSQASARSVSAGPPVSQPYHISSCNNQHSHHNHHHQQQQQQQQQQQFVNDLNPFQSQMISAADVAAVLPPHNESHAFDDQLAARTRLSSFGSATVCRNICANHNNNSNHIMIASSQQNNHQQQQQPTVFLKPSEPDKSWQKSCSDPTLNMLAQKCHHSECQYNLQIEPTTRMICDHDDNSNNNTETYCSAVYHHTEPHDDEQYDSHSAEVPGIKICAIDESSDSGSMFPDQTPSNFNNVQQQQQQQQQHQHQPEGSLPNLANLEFVTGEPVGFRQNQPDQQQTAYCDENNNNNNHFAHHHHQNQPNGHQQMTNNNNNTYYWTAINESLYAPKVNNTLSVSEYGLTSCSQPSVGDHQIHQNNLGPILRSRSHNSIDNLARRKMRQHNNTPTNISYANTSTTLNHQPVQYQQTATSQQFLPDNLVWTETSQQQQQPIESPLNSSLSNLTSPQSEQNSPASSTNANNECGTDQPYLPHHHHHHLSSCTSNLQQPAQQQQQQTQLACGYIENQQIDFLTNQQRQQRTADDCLSANSSCAYESTGGRSSTKVIPPAANGAQQVTGAADYYHSCSQLLIESHHHQQQQHQGLPCRTYSNSSSSLRGAAAAAADMFDAARK